MQAGPDDVGTDLCRKARGGHHQAVILRRLHGMSRCGEGLPTFDGDTAIGGFRMDSEGLQDLNGAQNAVRFLVGRVRCTVNASSRAEGQKRGKGRQQVVCIAQVDAQRLRGRGNGLQHAFVAPRDAKVCGEAFQEFATKPGIWRRPSLEGHASSRAPNPEHGERRHRRVTWKMNIGRCLDVPSGQDHGIFRQRARPTARRCDLSREREMT